MKFTTNVLPLMMVTVVLGTIGVAIGWSVRASTTVADGPVELVWDKAACAACGMHVGEPAIAAQLTTKDGRTHAFDDPGCLFLFVAEQHPDVHATWFRHCRENRWIAGNAVAFARIEPTPMGFGFGAVDANEKGAVDSDVARRECLQRTSGHGDK